MLSILATPPSPTEEKRCRHIGCGVILTESNRAGHRLLCIQHGLERDRDRYRVKTGGGGLDPEWKQVHDAVTAFLTTPTNRDLRDRIDESLKLFEVQFYMRAIAARLPTEHRTIGMTKHCPQVVSLI